MNRLRIWYFFQAAVGLVLIFSRAAWSWRLGAAEQGLPPGMMQSRHRRRLRHYYYGITYLAALYAAMLGRGRTRQERRQFVRLAALASYFDDLSDAPAAPKDRFETPQAYGAANDTDGVAQTLLSQIQADLPTTNRNLFQENLLHLFRLETSLAHQTSQQEQITAEKGGRSVLLFRALLDVPIDPAEQNALYAFGNLIQWCDDVFDLWFDLQAGANTPAGALATQHGADALADAYEKQVWVMDQAFQHLPNAGPARQVAQYIVALGRLCIAHYRKLQQKHGTLPLQNRQLMVVDMNRWCNRLLLLYFLVK